ncbi:hypothetical protein NIES3585_40020 [Nodularia sp. NIES-3585]|nr:hypothetical protein NIES3585_40020 [Nodularia sp. NIES-3585]
MRKPSNDSDSLFENIKHEKDRRVGLQRVSLLRNNRSHAPVEVESKV